MGSSLPNPKRAAIERRRRLRLAGVLAGFTAWFCVVGVVGVVGGCGLDMVAELAAVQKVPLSILYLCQVVTWFHSRVATADGTAVGVRMHKQVAPRHNHPNVSQMVVVVFGLG